MKRKRRRKRAEEWKKWGKRLLKGRGKRMREESRWRRRQSPAPYSSVQGEEGSFRTLEKIGHIQTPDCPDAELCSRGFQSFPISRSLTIFQSRCWSHQCFPALGSTFLTISVWEEDRSYADTSVSQVTPGVSLCSFQLLISFQTPHWGYEFVALLRTTHGLEIHFRGNTWRTNTRANA